MNDQNNTEHSKTSQSQLSKNCSTCCREVDTALDAFADDVCSVDSPSFRGTVWVAKRYIRTAVAAYSITPHLHEVIIRS